MSDALMSMGYTVDNLSINVEKGQEYYYNVSVVVSTSETAEFTFEPWQAAHDWRYNTMTANNALAQSILNAMR